MAKINTPTILIIVGISGDLSRRKLLPAIREIAASGVMPVNFKIIGITRRDINIDEVMPINGEQDYLKSVLELYKMDLENLEDYKKLLLENFNPMTLDGLMCRNTLSVGWDGKLYDCDFNQMLGLQMRNGKPLTISDVHLKDLEGFQILTDNHCFGCSAGTGSSCQGTLLEVRK